VGGSDANDSTNLPAVRSSARLAGGQRWRVSLPPDAALDVIAQAFESRASADERPDSWKTPGVFVERTAGGGIVLWSRPQPASVKPDTRWVPYPDMLQLTPTPREYGTEIVAKWIPHPTTRRSGRNAAFAVVFGGAAIVLALTGWWDWYLLALCLPGCLEPGIRWLRRRREHRALLAAAHAPLAPHLLAAAPGEVSAFRRPGAPQG
jgi:hypothetical protein